MSEGNTKAAAAGNTIAVLASHSSEAPAVKTAGLNDAPVKASAATMQRALFVPDAGGFPTATPKSSMFDGNGVAPQVRLSIQPTAIARLSPLVPVWFGASGVELRPSAIDATVGGVTAGSAAFSTTQEMEFDC